MHYRGLPLRVVITPQMYGALTGMNLSSGEYAGLLEQIVVRCIVDGHRHLGRHGVTRQLQLVSLDGALGVSALAIGFQIACVVDEASQSGGGVHEAGSGYI